MRAPTIHLNGTSRLELIGQLCAASSALTDAMRALQNAAPNGRDYYPQGPDAYSAARLEHDHRIARLSAIQIELINMADAIDEAAA